jgi:hypothetical protein
VTRFTAIGHLGSNGADHLGIDAGMTGVTVHGLAGVRIHHAYVQGFQILGGVASAAGTSISSGSICGVYVSDVFRQMLDWWVCVAGGTLVVLGVNRILDRSVGTAVAGIAVYRLTGGGSPGGIIHMLGPDVPVMAADTTDIRIVDISLDGGMLSHGWFHHMGGMAGFAIAVLAINRNQHSSWSCFTVTGHTVHSQVGVAVHLIHMLVRQYLDMTQAAGTLVCTGYITSKYRSRMNRIML